MALDPNIPLSAVGVVNPLQLAQAQRTGMELQQAQEAQQARVAMRDLFRQPGTFDQSGMIAPEAVQKVLGVNPEAGMSLMAHNAQIRQQALQQAHVQSQIDSAKALTEERKAGRLEKQRDLALKSDEAALSAYDAAIASGAPEDMARQRAAQVQADEYKKLQSSGLFPDLSMPGGFDPEVSRRNILGVKGMLAQQQQEAALKRETQKEEAAAARQAATIEASDRRQERSLAASDARQARTLAAISERMGGNVDSALQPEEIDFMARQAWKGDRTVFQNLGRGAQGAKNVVALRRRMMEIGKEEGRAPEELAAANAEFEGIKAGERVLGTQQANVDMAVTEAQNLIPLALKASEEAKRTGIKSVNDLVQYAQGKTASPELRRLAGATNALINVYARAISPRGVPTVSDKDHAREVLDKAFSSGDFAAAVDQMRIEMEQAQRSPGQVREHMRGAVTGQGAKSGAPLPADKSQLKAGAVYQTARGPAKWNGSAFEAQ